MIYYCSIIVWCQLIFQSFSALLLANFLNRFQDLNTNLQSWHGNASTWFGHTRSVTRSVSSSKLMWSWTCKHIQNTMHLSYYHIIMKFVKYQDIHSAQQSCCHYFAYLCAKHIHPIPTPEELPYVWHRWVHPGIVPLRGFPTKTEGTNGSRLQAQRSQRLQGLLHGHPLFTSIKAHVQLGVGGALGKPMQWNNEDWQITSTILSAKIQTP